MDINTKKSLVADTMTRIYKHKMTTTSGGNISIIDEENNIFITPSGVDKGSLTADDIMIVQNNSEIIGVHRPSVEYPFHQEIYKQRPDIKAIVHAHPVGLVALSAARKTPMFYLVPLIEKFMPKVSIAKYALPGSKKLGANIAGEFAKGNDIVILENHGVVVGGRDINQALIIFETLEAFINFEINARTLGGKFNEPYLFPLSEVAQTHLSDVDKNKYIEIIEIIKRSYSQKLINSFFGSFSQRIDNDTFIMTPGKKDRLVITTDDLVLIKGGKVEENKEIDSLYLLHQKIYETHPEINSLIFAMPEYMMAFSITDINFDSRIIPEGYILLREVLEFQGNQETAIIKAISKQNPVVNVKNNFIISAGKNLFQAFDRLEVLEFGARTLIKAKNFEKIYNISEEEIDEIIENFEGW